MMRYPCILTIAGSDSGGGAGIQADIKTISATGCFAASAVTAVTVQNTVGVTAVHAIPAAIVEAQIHAVMSDLQPAAIKTGMIPDGETALAIASALAAYAPVPFIIDPVMIASSGYRLGKDELLPVLKQQLLPLATLVTPNLHEAAALTGMTVDSLEAMKRAARAILALDCKAVLVKGGHLEGEVLYDVYLDNEGQELVLPAARITTNNLHGTGCTLSAAIASYMAIGNTLSAAVIMAKNYLHAAIVAGKDAVTGKGNGPLDHFFDPQQLLMISDAAVQRNK